MVDVNISSTDNLSGQPQDDDVVPIIRNSTTVFSQSWDEVKDALIPDPTARSAATAAQSTADGAVMVNTAQQAELDAVNEFTAADEAKLDGIETGATADQTGGEIVSAIDNELGSDTWQEDDGGGGSYSSDLILDGGGFSDGSITLLTLTEDIVVGHLIEFTVNTAGPEGTLGISGDEWLAMPEQTSTPTDVSEAKGIRLNSNSTSLTNRTGRAVYIWRSANANEVYALGVSVGGTITMSVRKSSLGGTQGIQGIPGTGSGLAAVSSDATLTGSGTVADPLVVANPFSDADETKLDGIETGADANVGVEFTSANRTKLAGIETGADANLDSYVHSVLTQAAYDALTPDANTIYLVT